jgi:hypothetical protein
MSRCSHYNVSTMFCWSLALQFLVFYAELYLVASTIVYSWSCTCENTPILLLIYSLLSSISICYMIHKPGEARMLISLYLSHNHAANISYIGQWILNIWQSLCQAHSEQKEQLHEKSSLCSLGKNLKLYISI